MVGSKFNLYYALRVRGWLKVKKNIGNDFQIIGCNNKKKN